MAEVEVAIGDDAVVDGSGGGGDGGAHCVSGLVSGEALVADDFAATSVKRTSVLCALLEVLQVPPVGLCELLLEVLQGLCELLLEVLQVLRVGLCELLLEVLQVLQGLCELLLEVLVSGARGTAGSACGSL